MFKLASLDNFLTITADFAQSLKHGLSPNAMEES